ncbi:MAG: DVU0772 family protein [Thermodesulfobacteriota bacterium]
MLNLEKLRQDRALVNRIDWEMTQEKAIEMYLEWGTGWVRGHDFVSYPGQESVYFVLYDWESPAQVTLIRRTTEGAEEIAKIPVPRSLAEELIKEDGYKPGVGVHSLNQRVKKYVCDMLEAASCDWVQ